MPIEQGLQGGVPANGQDSVNADAFAPASAPVVSTPTEPVVQPSILGVPAPKEEPTIQAPEPDKKPSNDDTRFEYWQKQAALRDNALRERDAQLNALIQQQAQSQQMIMASMQAQPQPVVEEVQPPEAPQRPERPSGWNREEALTDPKSESGKYQDALDKWRSDMDKHNQDLLSYERTKLEKERLAVEQSVQQFNQAQQLNQQYAQAEQLAMSQYGLNQEQAREFVQTYSDPSNVTMDNLVNMYKMQRGIPVAPASAPTQPMQPQPIMQPSPTFQQTQATAQLVPPMGVAPAQAPLGPENMGRAFMASLTGNQVNPSIFGE